MYDMKKDAPKEGGTRVMGSSTSGKGAKTGHMETKMQHPGGNESYVLGSAGKVGLYLKDMGRSKGY